MKKVNDILRENQLLKKELEGILEVIAENEVKSKGLKVVEYSFLLSETLKEIDEKPMSYLEEIFEIDKAALFINFEELIIYSEEEYRHIFKANNKTFKYFFIEKRPYLSSGTVNLISEFNIMGDIGSYLISPIILNDKIIGSLNLYSKNPNRYTNEYNSDFIKDLCFKIGIALKNINTNQMLINQSMVEESSGCYNKKAMYLFLNSFINRCYRYGHPFTFIILDIDDFKKINDTKGHLLGDEVLAKFGQTLVKSFRKSDIVGRFGGDEFYIITPESKKDKIEYITSKTSTILSEIYKKTGIRKKASISFGYITIESIDKTLENPEMIFKLADTELYKMKKEKHIKR
ncbi:sensor domain-containing diguanylate cyclase [Calditerrivibrio sp.]|uniref:sensor domain-containing diguanylate cyclase n=1 Tax=Calditerrivibrio sp. TaxID=2792612 RepID=UPI003D10A8F4